MSSEKPGCDLTYSSLILASGIILRLLQWPNYKGFTWDEAAHSLAGVMLGRWIQHGLSMQYLERFISHYWAATGSLFFYPYGYDALSTISFLVFGFNVIAARIPNMLFSILIIHACYRLGKEVFNKTAGYLAAMFAAANPAFVFFGGMALTDVPLTCLFTYSLAYFIPAAKEKSEKKIIYSAVFFGLGFMMKPTLLLLLPGYLALAHLLTGVKPNTRLISVFMTVCLLFPVIYFGSGLIGKYLLPMTGVINQDFGDHMHSNIFAWINHQAFYAAPDEPMPENTVETLLFYPRQLSGQMGGLLPLLALIYGAYKMREKHDERKMLHGFSIFILLVYLPFTFVPNRDIRFSLPYVPLFIIFAVAGIMRLTKDREHWLVPLTILVLSFGVSDIVNTHWYRSPTDGMHQVITTLHAMEPGVITVGWMEETLINIQTVSFHSATRDPDLSFIVYWVPRKGYPTYVISQRQLEGPGLEHIKTIREEATLYLYRTEYAK